jgi:deoxyribodipyrimidine photolyase-related protein
MSGVSVWILGDQLLQNHPAIIAAEEEYSRERLRIVLVESTERIGKLPYQRKKLVLLLSAMRHYAKELQEVGYEVEYVRAGNFVEGLQQHLDKHQSERLFVMAASEYDTRMMQVNELEKLVQMPVTVLPNTQFLVEQYNPNPHPQPGKHYILETFYRDMRRHFHILMDGKDTPAGGRWNYDELNREPLPRTFEVPPPPSFSPDEVTREVIQQVDAAAHGLGSADGFDLAVTREQAMKALDDFVLLRLGKFGPYEDAMSTEQSALYHSQLSPYMNIGLLDSLDMVHAAEAAYRSGRVPVNSAEGFVRQVIGWREFMYWQYWQQMPGLRTANSWNATRPMPMMFWNGKTEMNCINHVANRVLDIGYNNHIERLMIVCNFCLLAGVDPAAVAEWFLCCYFDAYDWVVLPNVIGMGLNGDGGRIATKPYIASANYINRMSNYCESCRYSPKKRTGPDACPYNYLYWNFLFTHEQRLRANPRLGQSVLGVNRIQAAEREEIIHEAEQFLKAIPYYLPEPDVTTNENVDHERTVK